jgi:regulatory protein
MTDKTIHEAVRDGIRILALRAHSRAELVSKLKKKGFDEETVEAAMSKFESMGLIDDPGFAAGYLESMSRRRPEGRFKARMRLLRKGVPEGLADEVLNNYDATSLCEAAAEKKMRSLSGTPEIVRKKLETFLRNRGFDWSAIRQTLSKLDLPDLRNDEDDGDGWRE